MSKLSIPRTPAQLVDEANQMQDLIQSAGWKALMSRVHYYLVAKHKEVHEFCWQMAFESSLARKEELRGRLVQAEADLRAVSVMFSIPANIVEQLAEQIEKEQQENQAAPQDPLEAAQGSSNGKLVIASR